MVGEWGGECASVLVCVSERWLVVCVPARGRGAAQLIAPPAVLTAQSSCVCVCLREREMHRRMTKSVDRNANACHREK